MRFKDKHAQTPLRGILHIITIYIVITICVREETSLALVTHAADIDKRNTLWTRGLGCDKRTYFHCLGILEDGYLI
jgi:hypothetical protein